MPIRMETAGILDNDYGSKRRHDHLLHEFFSGNI